MKGELMESKQQKQKITLLLTGESIALIKEYGADKLGTSSISQAVRAMAKEYEQQKLRQEKNH
jgi:hypothetical protein